MTKSSLLRLSKAYEKGQLTKETYRRRRSELIRAVLDASVDDDTITKSNKIQAKGGAAAGNKAPVSTPQLSVPEEDGGGSKGLLIGGVVAVLLVAGTAFMLLSGDGESSDGAETVQSDQQQPAKPMKPMSNAEVMISFTEEILSDRNVGDSESSKLYNLWQVSKEDEREAWKTYADAKLIAARNEDNDVLVLVMEDLYFDLDVETPDFDDLPPPVPEEVTPVADTAIVQSGSDQISDLQSDAAVVATEMVDTTSALQDTVTAAVDTMEDAVAEVDATIAARQPDRQAAESELLGAVENELEEVRSVQEDLVAQTPEVTPPSSDSIESAVDAAIEASTSAVSEVVEATEEVAAAPLFEATSELIEQQQEALVRTGADVVAAISQLTAQADLSLETITEFNNTLTTANRDERIAATYSADYDTVQMVYEKVRNEESRYSFDGLEADDRLRGLKQASRTLRQLARRVKRNEEQLLSGIADDGRMGAEAVTAVNADSYTLQLLGSSSLDGVRQYLADHADMDKLFFVELVRDGSPWYVVLQGEYPSKEVALIVYESFPDAVQQERARAWARSFESIQAVLAN